MTTDLQSSDPTVVTYFCTYFDHNYLAQGLAMYRSLRRWCPEAHLFILALSEEAYNDCRARALDGVTLIAMGDFESFDPELLATKTNRSRIEYIFTCTPCLCRYVFSNYPQVGILTYLDADLYFYSSLKPMFDEFGISSIGIIPHDYTSPRYRIFGEFNVGWVILRRDRSGSACIEWWRERCLEWCKDKVEPTRYADQKYLDRWPSMFNGVYIYNNPGMNLARWNIAKRQVSIVNEIILVGGKRLIFFHFANFKQVTQRLYQPNFATHWVMPSRLVKKHIFRQYIAELYAISGPILPEGTRQKKVRWLKFQEVPEIASWLLRSLRSVFLLDYIFIPDPTENARCFRHAIELDKYRNQNYKFKDYKPARPVWFIFADTPGFSGQKEATRIIYDNIDRNERAVELIKMPALNRSQTTLEASLDYLYQACRAIGLVTKAMLSSRPLVHLSLGQTKAAMIRDAIPLLMIMGFRNRKSAIVSLNGSIFIEWKSNCYEARWFRLIMTQASVLTVLGQRQVENAVRLGVEREKIRIVNNACDATPDSEEMLWNKHSLKNDLIRILHLSSLIDTKGYPVYLEALEILSKTPGGRIDAVLCGNITSSQYSAVFKNQVVAKKWIDAKIDLINRSSRVRITWIPGVTGAIKEELYRSAHIFVFPSSYKVEAQPLVLLEAMAHGCTIISSNVGEIRGILDSRSALVFDEIGVADVVRAVETLAENSGRRLSMSIEARRVYQARFSREIYFNKWTSLLHEVDSARLS
jgi:glycosyltransferase involved in cell wall biosynthesis